MKLVLLVLVAGAAIFMLRFLAALLKEEKRLAATGSGFIGETPINSSAGRIDSDGFSEQFAQVDDRN
jgi:hypothetical protein